MILEASVSVSAVCWFVWAGVSGSGVGGSLLFGKSFRVVCERRTADGYFAFLFGGGGRMRCAGSGKRQETPAGRDWPSPERSLRLASLAAGAHRTSSAGRPPRVQGAASGLLQSPDLPPDAHATRGTALPKRPLGSAGGGRRVSPFLQTRRKSRGARNGGSGLFCRAQQDGFRAVFNFGAGPSRGGFGAMQLWVFVSDLRRRGKDGL